MLSGPVLLCWGSFRPSLSSPPWPSLSVRCHALETLVQARPCLPTHTLPELIFKHNCDQDTLLPLLLGSGRKMQKSSNKKEKNHKTACHRSKKIRKFPKEEWPTFGCGKFHGKKKKKFKSVKSGCLLFTKTLLSLRLHSPKMLVKRGIKVLSLSSSSS